MWGAEACGSSEKSNTHTSGETENEEESGGY